jgi:uncharacterized alkaline shock family protein YloU
MAMNPGTQGYLLPCGRDVEMIWERLPEAETGVVDEHELSCPYCGQARIGLAAVRDVAAELARDDAEPSPGLTGRIMSAVRADLRRRELLPLAYTDLGPVRISERAVAAVLRFAADSVAGVRARRCRVKMAVTEDNERTLTVEMGIAVSYRAFAAGALSLVRQRVSAAAASRIGSRVIQLDLTVTDLYDA